ncbi:MAG: diguanylate cyclase [Oscillospiraceae bacterium]|nr:diguanylate cyclase [Oscillospiraceae bacterium]
MNMLLVLRSEIVCAIILVLLLVYYWIYGSKTEKIFFRVCLFGLTHVIFDGVTVYTVNHRQTVDASMNEVLHMLMYLSAICFGCEIFCYILKNLISSESLKKYLKFVRLPVLLYAVVMPFLKIVYLPGNGTDYSAGSCTLVGFAIVALYNIAGMVILLVNIRRAEKTIITGLLPCNMFVLLSMLIQLSVVEFFFTGAAVTLVTMGLFFTIENPAAHFMKRAYIDLDTGIKNKNCYNEDMKRLDAKYFSDEKGSNLIICVVCDLNGLKTVNDNYGHIAGDELIRAAADVLSKNLRSAYNVYRIGGDEFVAVFIDKNKSNVEKEIADVRNGCNTYTDLKQPLSIAIGAADVNDDEFVSVFDVISLADKRMYEDKIRIKESNPAISVR